ncbi:MAG TPA: hypothetical protein VF178_15700 [Gemmatimonadaceae bacterium]
MTEKPAKKHKAHAVELEGVEWVRHGDGNEYPYRHGQRVTDPGEIVALHKARKAKP